MNGGEISSICSAVRKVIADMPIDKEFDGRELKSLVSKIYPNAQNKYEDTILRCARKVCRNRFICIQRHKSLYKKVA